MIRLSLILALLTCSLHVMGASAHVWTSRSGAKLEAEFESVSGDVVHLKKPDGTDARIRLDQLSEEDRAYIRQRATLEESAAEAEEARARLQKICDKASERLKKVHERKQRRDYRKREYKTEWDDEWTEFMEDFESASIGVEPHVSTGLILALLHDLEGSHAIERNIAHQRRRKEMDQFLAFQAAEMAHAPSRDVIETTLEALREYHDVKSIDGKVYEKSREDAFNRFLEARKKAGKSGTGPDADDMLEELMTEFRDRGLISEKQYRRTVKKR